MGFIRVHPEVVQYRTLLWFWRYDEWPTPRQMHEHLAENVGYPIEHSEFDVLNALNTDDVYGLHSVVAMRHGEAAGDWRDPLPDFDAGWRLTIPEDVFSLFNVANPRWPSAKVDRALLRKAA